MDKNEKIDFINEHYHNKEWSLQQIAEALEEGISGIRKFCRRNRDRIQLRTQSESQKLALKHGRSKHPTKGITLTDEQKEKIAKTMREKFTPEKIAQMSEEGKAKWRSTPTEEKEAVLKRLRKALRDTSTKGSKSERALRDYLTEQGFVVEHQVEKLLENHKMHIDILLPDMGIAIEVDGPSHFEPVWGEVSLTRTIKADTLKFGLLIKNGYQLIRVKCWRRNAKKGYIQEMCKKVHEILEEIKQGKHDKTRMIEIEAK